MTTENADREAELLDELRRLMRRREPLAEAVDEIDERRDTVIQELTQMRKKRADIIEITKLSRQRIDQIRQAGLEKSA